MPKLLLNKSTNMLYTISYLNPLNHIIQIELLLQNLSQDVVFIQAPSWRPGRYELANFAKNILNIEALNEENEKLPIKKVNKDRWEVQLSNASSVKIKYNYYAYQMDAGNSWLDEDMLYINFINCLLYVEGHLSEPCEVLVHVPENYTIASGLAKKSPHHLQADNYYILVDSPMIASPNIQKYSYEHAGTDFHIWVQGLHCLDMDSVTAAFKAFTKQQVDTLGDFPCKDYHFLILALPYKHYHGVEHYNSTVITLGPGRKLHLKETLNKLLGISSHELFHTWNIIRIRPKEMMPYDFTKENYFDTGYVAEGFTTYYGDLFLVRSGVFTKQEYFYELDTLFKRHFENHGRHNLSVAESSYDLWLDGYSAGVPGRKVSIYVKGALLALILDLQIRKVTNGKKSLDDVMKVLWDKYGKAGIGYSSEDICQICSDIADYDFRSFWKDFVEGTFPLEYILNDSLAFVGCQLQVIETASISEKLFGFRTLKKENYHVVSLIEPGSPAAAVLSINDEIIAVNDEKIQEKIDDHIDEAHDTIAITLFRNGMLQQVKLSASGEAKYFNQYVIAQHKNTEDHTVDQFTKWLKCNWK